MPIPRQTKLIVEGQLIILSDYYADNQDSTAVTYDVFKQRCKASLEKRGLLSFASMSDAVHMDSGEWATFYGGGKHKPFIYTGALYKEFIGVEFKSLAAFLRTIGEYENYGLVKSRLQRPHYTIDEAICKPARTTDVGRIYLIQSTHTSKKYVGQTVQSLEERFNEHLAIKSDDGLRQALKLYGKETFEILCLDDDVPNHELHIREQFWIDKYNTMEPTGFNRTKAQPSACGYGKAVEWEGKKYPSQRTAVKEVKIANPHLAPHVIEKCIRNNKPLPKKARIHSKHHLAGTNIFRRWLAHFNNDNLCDEWAVRNEGEDGFEAFLHIVGQPISSDYELCPIDGNQKLSPTNFQWLTTQEKVDMQCGEKITAFGKEYTSHSALAKQFGIPLSTLKDRLSRGQTPEEAVSAQNVTTKRKPCSFDGLNFISENEMFHYIAEKFNITFGQAKDRYARGLPFDKPSHAKQCIVEDIHFRSESEAARHFGINKATFGKRRNQLGWTLEEALGLVAKKNRN